MAAEQKKDEKVFDRIRRRRSAKKIIDGRASRPPAAAADFHRTGDHFEGPIGQEFSPAFF